MALRGMAYSVRMAAYNADGARVTGLVSTITATLWADGTAATLTGITITEIGTTGVYVIPLTPTQMTAYNLCVTATSSTAGITFDPVYLDTEAGRIDVATSTRLATSGYTIPPTVNDIQSGLAKTSELPSVPTVSELVAGVWTANERTITGGILTIPPPTLSQIVLGVLGTNLTTLDTAAVGSLKTLFLLQTNAMLENNQINIYELDGTTVHTVYHVMMNNDAGITGLQISIT
ncbi:MAG: hypothetical protein PHE53_12880 [Thermoguttaceae bacterium]|nr:hypothetical protein [Thermoguttaceae bacterium]